MQKADKLYFDELVKKYMADEFTEAQAKYLAYKEMEFPIPDDIKKKVSDEEMTMDMTGGFLPLKIKKKIKRNPEVKDNAKEFSHFDILIENLYDFEINDQKAFALIRRKHGYSKYFQLRELHPLIGKPAITREKILSECKLILNIREDVAIKFDDEITKMTELGMSLENIKLAYPDYDYHLPFPTTSFFISLPKKKITTFKTMGSDGEMDVYNQGIYVKSLMVDGRISYKFYVMIEMYMPQTPVSESKLVGKFLNFSSISEKEFIELPAHDIGNATHFMCYLLLKGITDCYLAGIREKRDMTINNDKGKLVKLKYPSSVIVYNHKQYEPADPTGVKYDFYKGRNVIGHYRHFYIKTQHGKRIVDETGHWVLDTTKPVGGGKDEFDNRPDTDFFKGRTYVKPHYNDVEHNDFVRKYIKMESKTKNNPTRKSNPIIIDALTKTDFIVRRTEDGKFFVIRKVPGGYTLASSKLGEDGEYIINSYSVSKFKNKKAAVEKAKEALGRKDNPRKVCEQCEKREATTKFRSIMVCSKCEDILSGEEKEYRGSNIEEYEEYDDEGNIVPRKENPTQFHGTIKEIDEDIKKQIIEMYKSGDTIIRIAKVVHLNSTLVKEVLAEANVPVRKGGHKERVKPNPRRSSSNFSRLVKSASVSNDKIKRKSNPTEESTINFMNEVMKGLPQKWVELRKHKFGSEQYNKLIKIIMWRQGAVLDKVSNSYVTTIMISSLFDSFDVVEKNPDYYYKLCIYVALFDKRKADSLIQKLTKDSFGYKSISYFDNSNEKGKRLYYDFMSDRRKNFVESFLSISSSTRLLDFTNFLREFSSGRYTEKHDVLISELTMKILKRPKGEELHQEEISHVKKIIKNIHLESMEVIARSKLFLKDYVKDIEKEKGNGNGKA